MYEKGTEVISDEQEAKRWYHTSVENGNEAAQNKLK
jgi:TPR repeat protein